MPHSVANVNIPALVRGLILLFLVAYSFTVPNEALARFLDDDQDEVDREELLNSENFNDEISYRPPIYWEHIYANSDMAVRVNGGSYNGRRFMYEEDIKLISPREYPATFAFIQERQQNLLGNFNDRQFRVTANGLSPLYLSILADGDSFKKNADLGLAAGFEFGQGQFLEIYYWSTNHLYNNKRDEDSENKVLSPTRTWGVAYNGSAPLGLDLIIKAEIDTPYKFDVADESYVYEYEAQKQSAIVSHGTKAGGHYFELSWAREIKRESKDFSLSDTTGIKKELNRRSDWIEGRYSLGEENLYHWTTGVMHIARRANYEWEVEGLTDEEAEDAAPESESPTIRRDESGAFTTIFQRIPVDGWRNTGYQFGLFLNVVRLNRSQSIRTVNELKFQAAWTYFITDTVQTFLNATFNVDGLYKNYPYSDKPFKPWDGGALNIIAAF